jgi:hypothetical protein
MKFIWPIGPLLLLFSLSAKAFANPQTTAFDGNWTVTIACHEHTDANVRAEGYTFHYPVEIKDGVLRGQRLSEGQPGWMVLDGKIHPDGSAELHAHGLTNLPVYALHHVQKATPYSYDATAQFKGARGSGNRIGGRTCELTFLKQ